MRGAEMTSSEHRPMDLDPTTIAVASGVGGVTLSAAGWAAREAFRRLSAARAAETEDIIARIDALAARLDRMADSQQRTEIVLTEIRGEQRRYDERIGALEAGAGHNTAAHSTLHKRIDAHADRLTRVETRVEMRQGAA